MTAKPDLPRADEFLPSRNSLLSRLRDWDEDRQVLERAAVAAPFGGQRAKRNTLLKGGV